MKDRQRVAKKSRLLSPRVCDERFAFGEFKLKALFKNNLSVFPKAAYG
jgi:hypothetical protein